jgi:hypothetical protein
MAVARFERESQSARAKKSPAATGGRVPVC